MNFLDFTRRFPDERAVIDYFISVRYPDGVVCPHCGAKTKLYHKSRRPKLFTCHNCNNDFSVFKGTIFEKSCTDLRVWFYAIMQILNGRKGISSLQLQRDTVINRKTAYRILKQIRLAMGTAQADKIFDAIVEIDETYIGGKPRKGGGKRGRGTSKTPVVGIKARNDKQVYAVVALPNEQGQKLTGKQLLVILNKVCAKETIVISDDFWS